jgi:hypothetical protein
MPVGNAATTGRSQDRTWASTPATEQPIPALIHPRDASHDRLDPHGNRPADSAAGLRDPGRDPIPLRHSGCRRACSFLGAEAWHHARLMAIEDDPEVLLELMELAVTWPELEYSETSTITPDRWMTFFENHSWADPDRVRRIFSVATDMVMTATRASKRATAATGCSRSTRST